jgi:alpha-1,6-mannosyltransferase
MKLLALTQSYSPTGGGVRTMLHAQRAFCAARGLEHVLMVPGPADRTVRDGVLTTHEIKSPRVPGSPGYRLLLRSDKVLRLLRAERPQVIEVHCAYNLPWTALRHRRRHGGLVSAIYSTDVPVAYVEAPLERRIGRRTARLGRRLAERYVRALYSRCDLTVALSQAMAERLRAIGVPRVVHVPLGVDLDTFTPARRDPAVRARLGATNGELLLIYTGRLDREKRPDLVLDAFARLPSSLRARLALVGSGPLRASLARRAAEVGGATVVPYVQDRAELAALLASADLYVSAMAHETFGLSVAEAQACGLPVVGVRQGAMVDRVDDSVGWLVEPNSSTALAAAIAGASARERQERGRRARDRVAQELSWNRTFETLLEIYGDART